ncbi:UNVERIFIED_CONTAM: hypothetical protein Slati_2659600, partial [Sesamum latifolium]
MLGSARMLFLVFRTGTGIGIIRLKGCSASLLIIFRTSSLRPNHSDEDIKKAIRGISAQVSVEMNEQLLLPYSDDDEALSNLISGAEATGILQGVVVTRGGPRISHLLFADDTLIFCQASFEVMHYICRILGTLEAASGLQVNIEKSSVVFSKNILILDREALAYILGVHVVDKHVKYLGMPAVVGRSKRE